MSPRRSAPSKSRRTPGPRGRATRERLLAAAGRLLYEQGIQRSGVEELAAAAGVTKPSLYQHFASKDALVSEVLEGMSAGRKRGLTAWLDSVEGGPLAKLRAVFTEYETIPTRRGFRGCPLVLASVECPETSDPVRETAREYKAWTLALFERLANEAGLREPDELARSLMLLIDGANVAAYVQGNTDAGRDARRAAERLIASHSQ